MRDLRSILLESCYYMLLAMVVVCREGYVAPEGVEEEVYEERVGNRGSLQLC